MPLAVDSHLYLLRLYSHTFRKPWVSAALEANKVGEFCECCLTFITGAQTLLSKPYHNNKFMTIKAFTFNSIQLTKAFQMVNHLPLIFYTQKTYTAGLCSALPSNTAVETFLPVTQRPTSTPGNFVPQCTRQLFFPKKLFSERLI